MSGITQVSPFAGAVAQYGSGPSYNVQLNSTGNTPIAYSQSTGSAHLLVNSSGVVTTTGYTGGVLPLGSYTATGTTANLPSGTGTWTFTLTVSANLPLPTGGEVWWAPFSQAFYPNPTWVQLDGGTAPSAVSQFTVDRGRDYNLGANQTGTGAITLYDTTGRLDPSNPNGPFFGEFGPMRLVSLQIYNPVNKSFNPVFTGYTQSWAYSFPTTPSSALLQAVVNCVDGFDPLNRAELIPDPSGITAFAAINGLDAVKGRMEAILAQFYQGLYGQAGANVFPTNLAAIFSGNVNLFNTIYDPGTTILSALQDAADAEFPGVSSLFMDKYANLAFRGRGPRFIPQNYSHLGTAPPDTGNPISFWNVGDTTAAQIYTGVAGGMPAPGYGVTGYPPISPFAVVPFTGIEWIIDDTNLVNASQAYPINVDSGNSQTVINEQMVVNGQSIIRYGPRTKTIPDLYTAGSPAGTSGDIRLNPEGLTALEETLLYGSYWKDNYGYPVQRISTLTFQTQADGSFMGNAWWNFVCGVELGDVITVYTSLPWGGGFSNGASGYPVDQFFVEGLHYVVKPGGQYQQITLTVDLSPRSWSQFFNGYQWYPGPIPPGVSAVPAY